jgi:hypothetical protein
MVHPMGGGSQGGIAGAVLIAARSGAALALLLALPAAARQKSSVFQVGVVVAPSARVSAEPGSSPRSLRLRIASNAALPSVQVGSRAPQPLGAADLQLPASGTVVVTLQY